MVLLQVRANWRNPPFVITIGNHFGGPEQQDSAVHRALKTAQKVAIRERDATYDSGSEGWINPIFIVPGSLQRPDFVGIRKGHFSKEKNGLVIMVAMPAEVVEGDGLNEFIVAALREAVLIAAAHFSARSLIFSTLKAEKIIRAIEREIRAT